MSIARHTVYNIVGSLLPAAISLVTVPFYLRAVGLERYGILAICWVLLGYFGLFELGLGPATAQKIASLRSASPEERSRLLWGAIFLCLAVGTAGGAILWLAGFPLLSSLRGVGGALEAEVGRAVPFLALSLPASTLFGVLTGALQGRERFLALNAVNALSNGLMSIMPLIVALVWSPTLPWLVAAVLGSRLVAVGLAALLCLGAVPLRPPVFPSRNLTNELFRFGRWVTGFAILVPVLSSLEKFLVGYLVGAAATSIYMVPFNLVSRLVAVPMGLASALYPRFAVGTKRNIDQLALQAVASLCALMTIVAVFLMCVMRPFFDLWIGASLGRQAAPIAYVIIAGFWFNGFSHVAHAKLMGSGRPDLPAKISLSQLLPYSIAAYFSVRLWGIEGAAFAWSGRQVVDMTAFFTLTGQLKPFARTIAFPALVVVGTMFAALLLPAYSAAGWISLGALLLLAAVAALRVMPQQSLHTLRQEAVRIIALGAPQRQR
ncbi:MAG: oligosaccharide flippase family protein [Sphingomonas sp.]